MHVWSCQHLDFRLLVSRSKRINLCCFKPPSLWSFVMAVPRNWHGLLPLSLYLFTQVFNKCLLNLFIIYQNCLKVLGIQQWIRKHTKTVPVFVGFYSFTAHYLLVRDPGGVAVFNACLSFTLANCHIGFDFDFACIFSPWVLMSLGLCICWQRISFLHFLSGSLNIYAASMKLNLIVNFSHLCHSRYHTVL